MDTDELCGLGVAGLADLIQRRAVSPVDVTEAYLTRIAALDPALSAWQRVTADIARAQAREAAAEIAAGRWRGPLHGIPYGVKDIIETAGVTTTHGSPLFRDHVPARDADCVARLRRAGAVMLGKTLTHEFAAAATTINRHYGTARNPWDTACIAGGSSGGSAVAVAAGLCAFALGSDTGGSIRNPAAMCGVVGLKPTHGRVSLAGVCPNVMTFDHVGPLAASARDAAIVLQAIAGYDAGDAASRDAPVPADYTEGWEHGVRGLRLALCPDFHLDAEVDAAVARAFADAVATFRDLGATVETVAFPEARRLTALFTPISGPEFAEFHRPFFTRDPDSYDPSVRERLDWSFAVTADEHVRALRERTLLRRRVADFFRGHDALLAPALPYAAPPIDTLLARMNGRQVPSAPLHRPFLNPHNVSGNPAVVLPMGFDGRGMPLSLQVVGPDWSEGRILAVAAAFEAARPEIAARRPPSPGAT
ncbi:MAG: amidase [Alphaproteobacteria bacterium]